MATTSKIEWTEATWNPITGCSKVSPGCKHCYAELMAKRLQGMGKPKYRNGFNVTIHEKSFHEPFLWRKPRMVFVNSMSDLFHPEIPEEIILELFEVMNNNPQHIFQVLTKRAERLFKMNSKIKWTPNIWMGVTVENSKYVHRFELLKQTDAHIKFLSCEPLLGPLPDLNLEGIDWVIVGGESGSRARPMDIEWVRDIRDKCLETNTPFFFKQWGGRNKKANGRLLDGRTWDEMPS